MLLSIGRLGTKFSEILIKIQDFSFPKMHLKMSSAKWRPFCPGGDELKLIIAVPYLNHMGNLWCCTVSTCILEKIYPFITGLYWIDLYEFWIVEVWWKMEQDLTHWVFLHKKQDLFILNKDPENCTKCKLNKCRNKEARIATTFTTECYTAWKWHDESNAWRCRQNEWEVVKPLI